MTQSEIDELRTLFDALGPDKWLENWEHSLHHHGCHVFDHGLGTSKAEPGFLASIMAANAVVSETLGEPLTLTLYYRFHKQACAHFKNDSVNAGTLFEASRAGQFRVKSDIIYWDTNSKHTSQRTARLLKRKYGVETSTEVDDEDDIADDNQEEVTESKRQRRRDPNSVVFNYRPMTRAQVKHKVLDILSSFYIAITKAPAPQKSDARLYIIAEMYRRLDLLHPFLDGNGRTNILVLQKVLTEHGYHPVIMDHYDMELASLEDAVALLKVGLERWEARVEIGQTLASPLPTTETAPSQCFVF